MKVLIGNIIALVASLLMVYSGVLKSKKKIIYVQTIQIGLSIVSNIVLGGITGVIINGIGFVRNILYYKGLMGLKLKVFICCLTIYLSYKFNNLGIIGFFPMIAMVMYVLFFDTPSVIKLKLLIIFTMIMWIIHDVYIKSYTSSIFNFVNIIANVSSICILIKKKRNTLKI